MSKVDALIDGEPSSSSPGSTTSSSGDDETLEASEEGELLMLLFETLKSLNAVLFFTPL
ncbi:MAG: hypothetical protein LKG11_06815 [Bacilli bacterium]|nr:hypothetical protein [Bacilli bacterium]